MAKALVFPARQHGPVVQPGKVDRKKLYGQVDTGLSTTRAAPCQPQQSWAATADPGQPRQQPSAGC